MNNLANLIANMKSGIKTKKLVVCSFHNKFVIRILRKLYAEGLIRGISFKDYFVIVSLKYDDNFSPVFFDIKIISTSGHRVYFTFLQVKEAYNKNRNFLLSTHKGLFFTNEIVLNKLNLGGEVILRINYF